MATVTVTHASLTGAAANPDVLVDGPKWDASHTVTGLENVDNTSDADKPVSTAQAAADAVVAAAAAAATATVQTNLTAEAALARNGANLTTNTVTNAKLAQAAAYTLKGNATASTANVADFTIDSLTSKATPVGADEVPIWDVAGSAMKKASLTSVVALAVSSGTIISPQGRLTLTSGTPVISLSASAQGTIYYDAYVGNQVPYYTGSADALDTIASNEVSMAMVSAASAGQVVAGNVYDIWWVHGGANRICIAMSASGGGGGGWASDTLPTGNTHSNTVIDNINFNVYQAGWQVGDTISASGVGATTIATIVSSSSVTVTVGASTTLTGTPLTVVYGPNNLPRRNAGFSQLDYTTRPYITNKNALTNAFNGATNYGSVSANQATYLGSFYATANGQTSMTLTATGAGGGNNVLALYNHYNRVPIAAYQADTTNSSWAYALTTWRAANNNANNSISYMDGCAQVAVDSQYQVGVSSPANSGAYIGVNRDSVTASPGLPGFNWSTAASVIVRQGFQPSMGFHKLTAMERCHNTTTQTFFGATWQTSPATQTQSLQIFISI